MLTPRRGALLLFVLCLLAPAKVSAAANHEFIGVLDKFSVGSPFADPPKQVLFEGPCGLAVDSAGSLYVSDYYHDTVDIFSSVTSPGLEGRVSQVDSAPGPCALAVTSDGDVLASVLGRQVSRFSPDMVPISPSTVYSKMSAIDPGSSTGVAVDPTTGTIYVDDHSYIAEYEADGSPVVTNGGAPVRIGAGDLGDGYGVAVSVFPGTAGWIYAADASTNTIKAYAPGTGNQPIEELSGAGNPTHGFESLQQASLAIDESTGHLFVVYRAAPPYYEHPLAAVDEYNTSGEYRGTLPTPTSLWFGEPSGLAVDNSGGASQGRVYVTSGNSEVETAERNPANGEITVPHPEEGAVYGFEPTGPGQVLEVSISGEGRGEVQSEPAGITCPGACAAEYDQGATVTLIAKPDSGSEFNHWSGACTGTAMACNISLGSAQTVSAAFTVTPQAQATVSSEAGGARSGPTTELGCFNPCISGLADGRGRSSGAVTGSSATRGRGRYQSSRRVFRGRTKQDKRIQLAVSRSRITLVRVKVQLRCHDGGLLYDDLSDFEATELRRGSRFSDVQVGPSDEVHLQGRVRGRGVRGKLRVQDTLRGGIRCDSGFVPFSARTSRP